MEKVSTGHRKPPASVIIKTRHPPPLEEAPSGGDGQRRPSAFIRSLSRASLSPAALLSLAKRRVARLLARCKRSSSNGGDDWVLLPLDEVYADDEYLKDGFIVYAPANTSAESLDGSLSHSHSGSCASDENVENENGPPAGLSRSLSSGDLASFATPPSLENPAPKYTKEQRLLARRDATIGDLATISEACELACDAFSRAWTTVEMSRIQRLHFINTNRQGRRLKPSQLLIGLS